MDTINLKAKAKVNLVLNVLGKRTDGYHELETVMQATELCDELKVSWEKGADVKALRACGGGCAIELDPGHPKLPKGPKNLAFKAASRMHDAFHGGSREYVKIAVTKRIPIAAGMAGGSSDAAAVIWALARLWGIAGEAGTVFRKEDEAKLQDIALSIGSDVPFCLGVHMGRLAAVCTGRGEKMRCIEPVQARIETFTPDLRVSTAAVYAELRESDFAKRFDVEAFLAAKTLEEKRLHMGNHLQAPAIRLFPRIKEEIKRVSSGSGGLITMQSGSGPTIFTVYEKEKAI